MPEEKSAFTRRVLDKLEQLSSKSPAERAGALGEVRRSLGTDRYARTLATLRGQFSEAEARVTDWEKSELVRLAIIASKRFRHAEVRDALLDIVREHAQEEIRAKAAGALVAQRDPAVVPALRQELENPRATREEIAVLKSTIKNLETLAPPPAPDLEPYLLRRDLAGAANEKNARIALLKRLIASLEDPAVSVRNQAVKALEQLRDKRAVPALIRKLEESANLRQDVAIMYALGTLGDPCALSALLHALERGNWDIVHLIAQDGTIAKVATREDLPRIKEIIERVRRKTPEEYGVPGFAIERFSENQQPNGMIAGIYHQALAQVADASDVPELLRAFAEDQQNMHLAAALRRIADPRALEPMRQYLAEGNACAAEVLGGLGTPGLMALKEGLRHPEHRVRETTVRAFLSAGGADLIVQCEDVDSFRLLDELAKNDPRSTVRFHAKAVLVFLRNPERFQNETGAMRQRNSGVVSHFR